MFESVYLMACKCNACGLIGPVGGGAASGGRVAPGQLGKSNVPGVHENKKAMMAEARKLGWFIAQAEGEAKDAPNSLHMLCPACRKKVAEEK